MIESSNKKFQVIQPLLLALMVALGMIVGYQLQEGNKAPLLKVFPKDQDVKIGQVEEVMRFLDSKYLYEPDGEELTDDMLSQLFEKLDPFSLYIPAKSLGHVQDNMNGYFKGIGIETIIMKDTLLVTNVIADGPADKAGIKKMDRILAVDSVKYTGDMLDFDQFRKHVQTSETPVSLSILRKTEGDVLTLEVLADHVNTNSVNHYFMLDDSIFYVRIDQFVSNTYREFMQALEEGQKDNEINSLIIDVRNNPGGYLNEVTKILSQFFDESEKLLVRTKVRNGKEKEYLTTGRTFYEVENIIVLINDNSASGSEVLAGALQDWDRGTVIGKESYGKGLVQEQYNLSSGAALRLTVANYYLPSGRSIQHDFNLDSTYFDKNALNGSADSLFYSLIENRPLKGARGIQPDVVVNDSIFEEEIWPRMFRDTWLDKQVITYIEEELLLREDYKELDIETLEFDEAFLDATSWWKKEKSRKKAIDSAHHQIILRAKIMQFLSGNKVAVKYLLQHDPYVREAVLLLK